MGRLRSLRKGYCDDPNFLHETVERVVRQLVRGADGRAESRLQRPQGHDSARLGKRWLLVSCGLSEEGDTWPRNLCSSTTRSWTLGPESAGIARRLEEEQRKWRERSLEEKAYLDATYLKVRWGKREERGAIGVRGGGRGGFARSPCPRSAL